MRNITSVLNYFILALMMRSIVYIFSFLLILGCESSKTSNNNTSSDETSKEIKEDPIKSITENVNRIDGVKKWTSILEREFLSEEGDCLAEYYYSSGQLEKINVVVNVDSNSNNIKDYYLSDGSVICVSERLNGENGISKESQYFLSDGNVLKIVTDPKESYSDEQILEQQNSLQAEYNSLLVELKNLPKKDLQSEERVREYFDLVGADPIEGVYDYASGEENQNQYRLTILKKGYKYFGYILEFKSDFRQNWPPSSKKFYMEESATKNVFTMKWIMGNGITEKKTIATYKKNLIEFNLNHNVILYKMYPKSNGSSDSETASSNQWQGNGSGIFISKTGHIVTNYHVVEDATEIEVEFKINNELRKFSAEVIQNDVANDLSIIKINDSDFKNLASIPYNLKTKSSDVGTEVYALGYPMALSIMGKEVKFTDGKISSKTGYEGDVTTYQTTVPLQPGNSGGPLFDHKGNFGFLILSLILLSK